MPDNIMVVSDIDDTIKWSHILDLVRRLEDAPDPTLAFRGMPELYTSLANDGGAKFFYVTGAPDIVIDKLHVDSIPQRWCRRTIFQKGISTCTNGAKK
jgi:phosphatidate phosphatase APP1